MGNPIENIPGGTAVTGGTARATPHGPQGALGHPQGPTEVNPKFGDSPPLNEGYRKAAHEARGGGPVAASGHRVRTRPEARYDQGGIPRSVYGWGDFHAKCVVSTTAGGKSGFRESGRLWRGPRFGVTPIGCYLLYTMCRGAAQ